MGSLLELGSSLSFTPFTFFSASLRHSLLLKSIELLDITFSVDVSCAVSTSLVGNELTLFPFFFWGSFRFAFTASIFGFTTIFLDFVTLFFFGLFFFESACCCFFPDAFVFDADFFATSLSTIFSMPLEKKTHYVINYFFLLLFPL